MGYSFSADIKRPVRRRGPRNGLLHHLPRGHSRCLGFRFDDRRRNVVPELYPDAHVPDHGRALRRRHARRGRGRGDVGSRCPDHRQPFRAVRPQAQHRGYRWRRVGTAIVRWPVPILVATLTIALIGLVTLPGYKTSYNDRLYIPEDIPANLGYAAADRHFSQARMMPEILMIESDHDMRNPADFLVLHRLAKAIFRVKGISRVQGITRPEGTPIEHTSIPFIISMQNATQSQNMN